MPSFFKEEGSTLDGGVFGKGGAVDSIVPRFGGYGSEGAFDSYFKPSKISQPGLSSEGVGWGGGAKLDFGVPTDYEGFKKQHEEEGFDWEKLGRTLQSIKIPEQQKMGFSSSRVGGGGRYDKSVFENPLLTREYGALYSQPLYKALG